MEIALAIAGGSTLGILVGKLFDVFLYKMQRKDEHEDKSNNEIETMRNGLKLLMLDRILYVGQSHLKKGYITLEDRRLLHNMHEGYKDLNGNGDANDVMDLIDELPLEV